MSLLEFQPQIYAPHPLWIRYDMIETFTTPSLRWEFIKENKKIKKKEKTLSTKTATKKKRKNDNDQEKRRKEMEIES